MVLVGKIEWQSSPLRFPLLASFDQRAVVDFGVSIACLSKKPSEITYSWIDPDDEFSKMMIVLPLSKVSRWGTY